MAKIHFAAEGVAAVAPTTVNRAQSTKLSMDHTRSVCITTLTRRCPYGQCTSYNPERKLLEECEVNARVDEGNCAAAVFSGLHSGNRLVCCSPWRYDTEIDGYLNVRRSVRCMEVQLCNLPGEGSQRKWWCEQQEKAQRQRSGQV